MKVFYVILLCASLLDQKSWPGVCQTGTQQSPIDISTREAIFDQCGKIIKSPLVFGGLHAVNVTATNNGHTLKWMLAPSSPAPTLSGGPLRHEYSFLQFHLHWLSEHAIDGVKYPLEIHMVFQQSNLTLDEALKKSDGLTVVGVLCEVHSGADIKSPILDQIITYIPELISKRENPTPPGVLNIGQLLSPQPQSYYTYQGSLTTPGCEEVVTWILMDHPLIISDTLYKEIHTVDVGDATNFRDIQPRNRVVYRSVASSSTMMGPGAVGLLATAINCLASNVYSVGKKGYCTIANMKKKVFGSIEKGCQ